MRIMENKKLEEKVHPVEVFGKSLTFIGNKAGIVSVPNRKNYNVVITDDFKEIREENYVFPIMVNYQTAYELYGGLIK